MSTVQSIGKSFRDQHAGGRALHELNKAFSAEDRSNG
jgi:hypothetical protein